MGCQDSRAKLHVEFLVQEIVDDIKLMIRIKMIYPTKFLTQVLDLFNTYRSVTLPRLPTSHILGWNISNCEPT